MKTFVAFFALLAAAAAAPSWEPAKAIPPRFLRSKNLMADPLESYRPEAMAKKLHKQSPAGLKPSLAQEDCGIENASAGRVVGGDEAEPHQFPWLAHMTCTSGGWLCTSSIIAEDWILTAGHCVSGCSAYSIIVGAHDRTDPEPGSETITSNESILHEDYSSFTLHNDIGLIKLPKAVTFSENVRLSCLPSQADVNNDYEDELTTVTGWGKLSDNSLGASERVNYAEGLRVMSNDDCAATYGATIWQGTICIDPVKNGDGVGVCSGDSGGPLNHREADGRYKQIGVTSFVSSGGCENKLPHGFTRMTSFLGWVSDNTGIVIP